MTLSQCGPDTRKPLEERQQFTLLEAAHLGIPFQNTLTLQEDFDVFRYRNYYNGGGVAIADINNDGLPDIFFTANMGENKLYLNKGNWQFEDITHAAGVQGQKAWSTGVSIADVNADGWLDIYVCNSGDLEGNDRDNELFINQHNLTFKEAAKAYGLADQGFSTHAAFFDYDKDGDLDCYVLNNSFRPISTLGYRNLRKQRDRLGGDKLYQNQQGRFVEVSEQAGIYGSVIGFGLGVTVGDVNQDNWPDLYISNDFYERDYLYINQHDGTFVEQSEQALGHLSMFSMGADIADLNNDGLPEIFTTDMLPEDDYRLKTMAAFERYDVYQLRLHHDYYHQFMRNMLHANNGNGTFSEIGQLAGVAATDWSWAALMVDLDNNGYKDIFVTNGIFKDVTNQDFVEYLGSHQQMQAAIDGKKIDFKKFVDEMPSQKISNYLFTRDSAWHYQNLATAWGLAEPGFSNGAAYGDLDNDGDLDLIVNNVNQPPFIYQNNATQQQQQNYLAIWFNGPPANPFGVGGTVQAYVGHEVITVTQMPTRGFQSSMDYKMIVGVGNKPVDSVRITWPDDAVEIFYTPTVNSTLTVTHANATRPPKKQIPTHTQPSPPRTWLQAVADTSVRHQENTYSDFDRDRLLYHMLSTQGPAYAQADINHDGLDDFFLGGAVGYPGKLYIQQRDGTFQPLSMPAFQQDSLAEDVAAAFLDADGDHDMDLVVVSGGSEHLNQLPMQLDRYYENVTRPGQRPKFKKTTGKLPLSYQSGGCVVPADWDHDGDLDLFIGNRVIPSYYGMPCQQQLLQNDGHGNFKDVTSRYAPAFANLGMVTDAAWFDQDADGFPELLVVGDWMPITVFKNQRGNLEKVTLPEQDHAGWWNRIHAADLDGDGDGDFVLGNLGYNAKFKPTPQVPICMYVNDFDHNGSIEPVYTYCKQGTEYPMAMRPDLIRQMASLKKSFVYYKDYAAKSLHDIFNVTLLDAATKLVFQQPATSVLWNNGGMQFSLAPLPVAAQFAPVYGITTADVNHDAKPDILLGGNLYAVKPEVGRYDALHGLVLLGKGQQMFEAQQASVSGVSVKGEVRHISLIRTLGQSRVAFIRNNNTVEFYRIAE